MTDVRKVTIEAAVHGATVVHQVGATVNVGGSLVELHCESEGDQELAALVEQLCARVAALAVETVRASLQG
jgi:hypothetical protein